MNASAQIPEESPDSEPVLDRLGDLNLNDDAGDAGDEDIALDSVIRLIRTPAYSDLIVSSAALTLLQDDWGVALSGAPAALGRLGQCFVLASEPLAASLVFPDNVGLPYKSLRTNLVHCSDLGRKAFRDAESGMNRLSMVVQALCEPNGSIAKIIEAVEDPILAELDLPEQVKVLKRMSDACVADTSAVKERFDAWRDFANLVYRACVEEDETLKRNQTDLDAQVKDKKMAVGLKSTAVTEIQKQAEYYNSQIADHKAEFTKAEKGIPKRVLPSFGRRTKKPSKLDLSGANVELGSSGFLSGFMKIAVNANWTKRQEAEAQSSGQSEDQEDQRDMGYNLADRLCAPVHRLAELLTLGPDELNGADWEQLAGRRGSAESSVRNISGRIHGELSRVQAEHTPIVRRVRGAIRPVEDVLVELTRMVAKERSVNAKIEVEVAESAKTWRNEVRMTEEKLSEILGEQLELAKKQVQNEKRRGEHSRKNALSRTQLRYERLRLAQRALLEVEEKANQRRERERQEIQDLEIMQQEFQKLLASEATMAQVKQIVRECVKKLQEFCAHIEQLITFFASMHQHIQLIDEMRVDHFTQTAGTTKTLGDYANAQTDETARLRRERFRERKLAVGVFLFTAPSTTEKTKLC
ncbi:unnamed protein product [Clonostachys rhizophaga]|uniref:Uncharacterized protein n=1 Tax=Clonostachys rhizophaga TaxID=160324 RepID=A0A9N9VNM5_9HYPO|nr:unnamed protein product [Clonostachys rhizophaga]